MEMAAKIAEENIDRGGGPFGAVIVDRDGSHFWNCFHIQKARMLQGLLIVKLLMFFFSSLFLL